MSKIENRLKIALLGTRGIPARYGGFETFAQELSTRLAERGHDVTVYGRTKLFSRERDNFQKVKIVRTGTIYQKYLETPVHAFTSNLHAMFQGYDVAIICNAANSPFAWMLRLVGVPIAINVDGIERKRSKWSLIGKLWYRLGEISSVLFASKIIADAEVIADYYRERFKKEPAIIAYGYREKARASSVLEKFGLRPERYVLYVSRFEPENHALEVVKAYSKINTELPLVMVGDAPYAKEYIASVKSAADSRVIFTGYQFDESYEELMSQCALYIQATDVGGTHPALVEAMGYGRCILANDVPEHKEVLSDAGEYYEKNNIDSLSNKLDKLLADLDKRNAHSKAAKERAELQYSWDKISTLYEALCMELKN